MDTNLPPVWTKTMWKDAEKNTEFPLPFLVLGHHYPRRRQWHPTPVLLPGKSHGRRSLVVCSPWGHWGSETTEWLPFHLSLSCIGEGNGTPLHCSCLENPRDGGAWWAAVYGVTQSRTRLTWLSSSSNHYPTSVPQDPRHLCFIPLVEDEKGQY